MNIKRITQFVAVPFVLASMSQATLSQVTHSDVFFRYVDSKIEIEPQGGRLVIPAAFPDSGFFAQASSNPGFFSETDIGGGTGPSDIITYNVLDDLLFWTDGEFQEPNVATEVRIINNPSFVGETVIGANTGQQLGTFAPLTNSIGQSSGGEFHSHIDFRLEPNPADGDSDDPPPAGAYGLKLSLRSDNSDIADSDPFLIVYQFGIEDETFEASLDSFADLLSTGTAILGDFDADGELTANDIDLLSIEVFKATPRATFDVNSDGVVSEADRSFWIDELASSLSGDADLNGVVEFADFLALSTAFGQTAGWAAGDFDGNGQIQFADFLTLSANFGCSSIVTTQAVPEPNSHFSLVLTMLFGLAIRRRP